MQPTQLADTEEDVISHLMQALHLSSDTLDAHLAFANLFRQRGDSAKAIRLHQNLCGRSGLNAYDQQKIYLELARDYQAAGLLDRAEHLLLDLVKSPHADLRRQSRILLTKIYEQEREWHKAIQTLSPYMLRDHYRFRRACSHYYCELAAYATRQQDTQAAYAYLQQAQQQDEANIRIYWMRGELQLAQAQYTAALASLQSIQTYQAPFLPLTFAMQQAAYQALDAWPQWQDYLETCLRDYQWSSAALYLAQAYRQQKGAHAALQVLKHFFVRDPQLNLALHLLEWHQLEQQEFPHLPQKIDRQVSEAFYTLLLELQNKMPAFLCQNCGFSGHTLYWQCPKCQHWGTYQPQHQ
ncbi:hypothetical protein [Allopseudospirillum japonicum]|uniref:hypothetical protein n=1 Tax=Allopseudospirillum japonicum TaxID=64971 RepID=UPI00115FB31E|nr:hypothetical protein [Allopseudospirillum japonicum]